MKLGEVTFVEENLYTYYCYYADSKIANVVRTTKPGLWEVEIVGDWLSEKQAKNVQSVYKDDVLNYVKTSYENYLRLNNLSEDKKIELIDEMDDALWEAVIKIAELNGINITNEDYDNEMLIHSRNYILDQLKSLGFKVIV